MLIQLRAVAKSQWDRRRGAERVEALNERVGRSQILLAYLVAYHLMRSRQKVGQGADRFWHELHAMEQGYADREMVRVKGIPAAVARGLEMPLFDPVLPTVGEEGYIDAPRLLLASALDAAARLADSLHVKKDDLSVADVMKRIEREIRTLTYPRVSES